MIWSQKSWYLSWGKLIRCGKGAISGLKKSSTIKQSDCLIATSCDRPLPGLQVNQVKPTPVSYSNTSILTFFSSFFFCTVVYTLKFVLQSTCAEKVQRTPSYRARKQTGKASYDYDHDENDNVPRKSHGCLAKTI